ncbi:uncharacterized protein LOC120627990 isoform X1 [Pararge aegeria]|uniref:uncharacterized protein LOC120627990 isoform X1 n=1 Tax=Pararge aegeria TaxID=116150 RepID=UPI0019D2899B|nr:uncharacterized protein LOC120627990 isoform X1 [Pararge aegeria]
MALWSIVAYVLILTVIEMVMSTEEKPRMMETLDDARMGGEQIALYKEMLKASQDAVGKLEIAEAFDSGTDMARLKGLADGRRSSRTSSLVLSRRVRSQALRRDKLNSQGLRSHIQHSRHSATNNE